MPDKIVGVIGGMGPEATVDLMRRVIQSTPAKDDIDHIRMIVDNNPKVPSRIKAMVEGSGESPEPLLVEMARKLEAYGADFLVMPCNTAHYYYDEVSSAVSIPVLNMIDLAVETVMQENPSIRTVALLASTAVLQIGLYIKQFQREGIDVIYPQAALQDQVMDSIRTIKTGHYGTKERDALRSAAHDMIEREAEVLIIACTELSLIANALAPDVKLYDSAQTLAEAIVRMAKEGI